MSWNLQAIDDELQVGCVPAISLGLVYPTPVVPESSSKVGDRDVVRQEVEDEDHQVEVGRDLRKERQDVVEEVDDVSPIEVVFPSKDWRRAASKVSCSKRSWAD